MLTNQQAAIVDHLKRKNQNGYIRVETPDEKRIAPMMLHKSVAGLFRGTPDEIGAYYEAMNEACKAAQAYQMTDYQNRVLRAMPDKWASIVEITDAIYPRRMNEKVHGLRRACVRNAIAWLDRNGYLISNKRGMFRPYDPSGYTSQHCGETVEAVKA